MASADKAQLSALRLVIEQQNEFYIVSEATDTHSVMEQVLGMGARILLLDWELPVRCQPAVNGGAKINDPAVRDLIPMLRAEARDLRIIILTLRAEHESEAYAAGAHCVLRKTGPPEVMLSALIKEINYQEIA